MKKNVGTVDRVLRIVMGIAILALGYYFKSWFGLIGIIPLLTGLAGSCGLYSAFGISTCTLKEHS